MKIFTNMFNIKSNSAKVNPINLLPVFRQSPTLTDDKINAYRTAAYALIPRDSVGSEKSDVLVLKNSTGVFLPGGGVDEIDGLGEDIPHRQFLKLCEETIKREMEEEIGDSPIQIEECVYEAIQVFHSPKAGKVIKQRCVFFEVFLEDGDSIDSSTISPDNTGKILWLPHPYNANWFHQAQKRALFDNAVKW